MPPRVRYPQARYWLLTIPHHLFVPYLPPGVRYIRGQLESGDTTGYLHWQLVAYFTDKIRLTGVKQLFGEGIHAEPSQSNAVEEYVWKEDTRVAGTQFELGERSFKRNKSEDWERIRDLARRGTLDDIPPDVYCRYYGNLRRIASDNSRPVGIVREVIVFWGVTGSGKSRRAWDEAGEGAYPKDPRTKFWDGYRSQEHVVIDEFRGGIDIGHVLRWFDRYPVLVEIKGSSTVLTAKKVWITSNIHPRQWYPDLDAETMNALLRRLTIFEFVKIGNGFEVNQEL